MQSDEKSPTTLATGTNSPIESVQQHENEPKLTGTGASTQSLNTTAADNCLAVDISDALSEKDKVKFTVHTRTTMPGYSKQDMYVVRQHEEFVWLHDRFEENEDYAGYIVRIHPTKIFLQYYN